MIVFVVPIQPECPVLPWYWIRLLLCLSVPLSHSTRMPNALTGPARSDVLHHGRAVSGYPMLSWYCIGSWLCLCVPFNQNAQCCHYTVLDHDYVCVPHSARMSSAVSGPARGYVLHHGRSVSGHAMLSWYCIRYWLCLCVPLNQNAHCCHYTLLDHDDVHRMPNAAIYDIALDHYCVCVSHCPFKTRVSIAAMILH